MNRIRMLTNAELVAYYPDNSEKVLQLGSSSYLEATSVDLFTLIDEEEGTTSQLANIYLPDGGVLEGVQQSVFEVHGSNVVRLGNIVLNHPILNEDEEEDHEEDDE